MSPRRSNAYKKSGGNESAVGTAARQERDRAGRAAISCALARSKDKEGYAFLAEGPLAHGINVAVVGYTLAPDARMDQIVGEIRHAVAWLAEHLADCGADPARIYVAGHSAGGHLTATAMSLGAVEGGLAISGLYDLEPIRLNYLNVKLGLDAAAVPRLNGRRLMRSVMASC